MGLEEDETQAAPACECQGVGNSPAAPYYQEDQVNLSISKAEGGYVMSVNGYKDGRYLARIVVVTDATTLADRVFEILG